jgi:acyl carrier protein
VGLSLVYQRLQKDWRKQRKLLQIALCFLSQPRRKEKETMSIRLKIIAELQQVAREQNVTLPRLTDDLPLHHTGLDSLGFAILVVRLEDELGHDPFTISDDAAFPLTVGDFVRAYENVPA